MKKAIIVGIFVVVAMAATTTTTEAGFHPFKMGGHVMVKNIKKVEVNQQNISTISNNITVVATTGNNSADHNSTKGGNVGVTSGNATVTVTVTNTTGGNLAIVNGCCDTGCAPDCTDNQVCVTD